MITLYGVAGPNVAKTRASLLLKQLKFEHVQVNLVNQSEEFRKITPIGRVPVICDDGLIVHDSLFISEYLDRKYSDSPNLLPEELTQRVKAYTIFALLERMYTIAAPLVAKRLGFFDLIDPARAACSGYYQVEEKLSGELEVYLQNNIKSLAILLGDEDYFTGSSAMQADFVAFAFLTFVNQLGVSTGPLSDWTDKRKSEFPFNEMFATDEVAISRAI